MKILAFDQASSKSGYAILRDGKYLASGVIDLSKIKNSEKRWLEMSSALCCMAGGSGADKIVIEDIQKQANPATYKMLARIQGAIMHYCHQNGLEFSVVPSTTWRRKLEFAQGSLVKKGYLKAQAIEYVKKNFRKDVSDHEADAICIGVSEFIKG